MSGGKSVKELREKLSQEVKQGVVPEITSDFDMIGVDGSTQVEKSGKTRDIKKLQNNLKTYMQVRGAGELLESAQIIREVLVDDSVQTTMPQLTYFAVLLRGIKKCPIVKAERERLSKIYYPTEESRATAPYIEWKKFSDILDRIEKKIENIDYLSAASFVIALEPIVSGMASEGLDNPDVRGWAILTKGPYHFCTYSYIVEKTKPLLSEAFTRMMNIIKIGEDMKTLIKFDSTKRPSRSMSENLSKLKSKVTNMDPWLVSIAINPANWRYAWDLRKPPGQGRLGNIEYKNAWGEIFEWCGLIEELGKRMNSPGLVNYVPKPDKKGNMPTPLKQMYARVAAITADIHFIIATIKSPAELGSNNRQIKSADEAMFAELIGNEPAKMKESINKYKSKMDDMYNDYLKASQGKQPAQEIKPSKQDKK